MPANLYLLNMFVQHKITEHTKYLYSKFRCFSTHSYVQCLTKPEFSDPTSSPPGLSFCPLPVVVFSLGLDAGETVPKDFLNQTCETLEPVQLAQRQLVSAPRPSGPGNYTAESCTNHVCLERQRFTRRKDFDNLTWGVVPKPLKCSQ